MPNGSEIVSTPLFSCDEARSFEFELFGDDEAKEWAAMGGAGRGVARQIVRDIGEAGGFAQRPRILVLVGKGHNAGDALIASHELFRRLSGAVVDVFFVVGERALRPLARRAWRDLQQAGGACVSIVRDVESLRSEYDLCIDGVFGFQFRPPLDIGVAAILARINCLEIKLRAAVDLPSGLGERNAFRADFTYATGVVKSPLLALENAGRIRHVDLGWTFPDSPVGNAGHVLSALTLRSLVRLRPVRSDKRTFGHLAVVGGSRSFPGAILMTVRAALRSGVGLLTAFVPESLVPSFAAAVPEAMWVGWPETAKGNLALEGSHLLRERLGRTTAAVIGPGMGREPETLAWLETEMARMTVPIVLDADALIPEIVQAGTTPRILTPHAGEFERIGGGADLPAFAKKHLATVVLKGHITRISDGGELFHSFFGGPVLARGGSGDMLAGLVAGLLAQAPQDLLSAAAKGVVWHGLAADALAQACGATAVTSTELLDYLSVALRRSL